MNPTSSSPPCPKAAAPDESIRRTVRRGRVSWLTHPPAGAARVTVESHAVAAMPVSLPAGDPIPGEATPGELLAMSYGMFLAAALSEDLALAGRPVVEVVVEAACAFGGELSDRELVGLDLQVWGRVPDIDPSDFAEAVERARPVALRAAGARLDLPGSLESGLYGSIERV